MFCLRHTRSPAIFGDTLTIEGVIETMGNAKVCAVSAMHDPQDDTVTSG